MHPDKSHNFLFAKVKIRIDAGNMNLQFRRTQKAHILTNPVEAQSGIFKPKIFQHAAQNRLDPWWVWFSAS